MSVTGNHTFTIGQSQRSDLLIYQRAELVQGLTRHSEHPKSRDHFHTHLHAPLPPLP